MKRFCTRRTRKTRQTNPGDTFADRSNSEKLDVSGISQLPRGLFPTMHVVLDSVQATSNSPFTLNVTVAFPLTQQGRPRRELISELNTQPGLSPVNASMSGLPHTTHHSGPRRLAKSYLVRNLHSLQSSGLCWRTVSPWSSIPGFFDRREEAIDANFASHSQAEHKKRAGKPRY